MGLTTYRELAHNRAVVHMVVISMILRVPMWAAGVVLTLHVVGTLDHSYAAAGVVDMCYALALAVSSPWRGRLLDRIGLRATVAPSLAVMSACWCLAPWVGYLPLLGLVSVGGLFMVPSFSIVRQVLIGAVPLRQRTAVLSVDSVFTEVTFMIGPVLGVLAATYLDTRVALLVCQLAGIAGGIVLWIANPSLGSEDVPDDVRGLSGRARTRALLTPAVLTILAVAVTATTILTAADLGTVAAMRHMHAVASLGWVLALWGVGSALGGIAYGALHRHPPSAVLLLGLAGTTAVVSLSTDKATFVVLLLVSGFFCAPTITATVADLTESVPAHVRGEAMGWHGAAMTLGGAAAAPVAGVLIDTGGWARGFGVIGVAGLVIAGLALLRQARSGGRVDPQRREDLAGGQAPVEGVEVQPGRAAVE